MTDPSSRELYELMLEKGYPEAFCAVVAGQLNTGFTAGRMIGWLRWQAAPKPEMVADEMLAILEERDRIIRQKESVAANARWNELVMSGLWAEEDEDPL